VYREHRLFEGASFHISEKFRKFGMGGQGISSIAKWLDFPIATKL